MLRALGLCCMDLSSRCGCRAEILAQDFHFQKCTTLNTKPPFFAMCSIAPWPNAFFQSDFKHTLLMIANSPSQIATSSQFCHTSQLICEFTYRMGGIARIRRFELFERRVLLFWSYVFQTAKMAGGGCSWVSGVLLGRSRRACYSRPGMLQPPWHVTGPSSAIISSRKLLLVRSCFSLDRF